MKKKLVLKESQLIDLIERIVKQTQKKAALAEGERTVKKPKTVTDGTTTYKKPTTVSKSNMVARTKDQPLKKHPDPTVKKEVKKNDGPKRTEMKEGEGKAPKGKFGTPTPQSKPNMENPKPTGVGPMRQKVPVGKTDMREAERSVPKPKKIEGMAKSPQAKPVFNKKK